MNDIEIRPFRAPAEPDAPDDADFRAMVDVRNRIYRELDGNDDDAMTVAELVAQHTRDVYRLRRGWLLLADGVPVGRAGVELPQEEGSRAAEIYVEVLRGHWGRGIGSQALAVVERAAAEAGRDIVQTWTRHHPADGEQVTPPTGFGALPLDHSARFCRSHGYELEQVVRVSAFDLTADPEPLRALLATAEAAASGYRVVQWTTPTPPERETGYAWMKSRMSTDAPNAGLEMDEERWDAARVHAHDQEVADGGRTMLVTAAEHIGTGELCAFNELSIGTDPTAASTQEDTLVLDAHRGHRLGFLVKCAGLLAWRDIAPASPRVVTYNAEENRPMLDINEALGFRPTAYEGGWRRSPGR